MSKEKFTNGPWRWEVNKKHKSVVLCGGKPSFDIDVLRFERYGMQGAQPTFCDGLMQGVKACDLAVVADGREHHQDWFMLLEHPDAHLIAAAPEMYSLLKEMVDMMDCGDEHGEGGDWRGRAVKALAKARGEND